MKAFAISALWALSANFAGAASVNGVHSSTQQVLASNDRLSDCFDPLPSVEDSFTNSLREHFETYLPYCSQDDAAPAQPTSADAAAAPHTSLLAARSLHAVAAAAGVTSTSSSSGSVPYQAECTPANYSDKKGLRECFTQAIVTCIVDHDEGMCAALAEDGVGSQQCVALTEYAGAALQCPSQPTSTCEKELKRTLGDEIIRANEECGSESSTKKYMSKCSAMPTKTKFERNAKALCQKQALHTCWVETQSKLKQMFGEGKKVFEAGCCRSSEFKHLCPAPTDEHACTTVMNSQAMQRKFTESSAEAQKACDTPVNKSKYSTAHCSSVQDKKQRELCESSVNIKCLLDHSPKLQAFFSADVMTPCSKTLEYKLWYEALNPPATPTQGHLKQQQRSAAYGTPFASAVVLAAAGAMLML